LRFGRQVNYSTTSQPTKTMAYEDVIKKFEQIQQDINSSNHDRMSYEDYEAPDEEITECVRYFGLGTPEKTLNGEVMLPIEFWNEAFGETDDLEKIDRIMETHEYKKLEELYSDLYDQVVVIATEMSAYYANEYEKEQNYHDSMRGSL
jgi:hypothetical protein